MSKGRAPLRAAAVGCGAMGRRQAAILQGLAGYRLVGVCDRSDGQREWAAGAFGVRGYDRLDRLIEEQRPDVVAITTPNASHAPLTMRAAEMGVRGIHCEKPMATNLADARAMVAACERQGAKLVINHQRRLGADLVEARRIIEAGGIGRLLVIRGHNAGDILSDGSHTIDSSQWLTGDQMPAWVLGQVHRVVREPTPDPAEPDKPAPTGDGSGNKADGVAPGFRYGHVTETGGMAVWELPDGVRVEMFSGDIRARGRVYQDYEIIGTDGELWRAGDRQQPNLFISDAKGGDLQTEDREGHLRPVPAGEGAPGRWRAIETPRPDGGGLIAQSYERLADMIHDDAAHPMSGAIALRGFEILMAAYESARTHRKLTPPVDQPRFPLELMVEAGTL